MNKENITCPNCEAEYYVESFDPIKYCVSCGESLDDVEIYREDEDDWDED